MDKLGNILAVGDRVAFMNGKNALELGTVSAVVEPSIRIERDDTCSWLPRLWRDGAHIVKVFTP